MDSWMDARQAEDSPLVYIYLYGSYKLENLVQKSLKTNWFWEIFEAAYMKDVIILYLPHNSLKNKTFGLGAL